MTKRVRRTRETIENNLMSAVQELIEENGFTNVTVKAIVNRADVEAAVFYKRYKDLDDLFDKFVRIYDYWLNDSVNFSPDHFSSVENCKNLLLDLVDSLDSNVVMQKLLIWELVDSNHITHRTADNRERNSKVILDYFNKKFKNTGVNFNAFSALLISGIYFLILHRNVSTFCHIDFKTKEGMAALKDTITLIVDRLFSNEGKYKAGEKTAIDIATQLMKQGVEIEIIKNATGLSDEILQKINTQK